MIDERSRRRPNFFPGISSRLADGQEWWLPAPGDVASTGDSRDPEYTALIRGLCLAEDLAELGAAELALGIYLLHCNYRLDSGDFRTLLETPSGSPQSVLVRATLHALACAHIPPSHPVEDTPWGYGLRLLLSRLFGRTPVVASTPPCDALSR